MVIKKEQKLKFDLQKGFVGNKHIYAIQYAPCTFF